MDLNSALLDLYDKILCIEDRTTDEKKLLPVGYEYAKADIEIIINSDGDFESARIFDPRIDVMIPDPEPRTNDPTPRPLFDVIQYIAGDYHIFASPQDSGNKTEIRYNNYVRSLEKWNAFDPENSYIASILKYISKRSVFKDLINFGVKKEKIEKNSLVIFRVSASKFDMYADSESDFWLGPSFQKSFLDYYLSTLETKSLCYLTGKNELIAKKNPGKISSSFDAKGKLISTNITMAFSYQGRFQPRNEKDGYNEALTVGFVPAQKVHNALKWIIRKQGYDKYGICTVVWESDLSKIPAYFAESLSLLNEEEGKEIESVMPDPFGKSLPVPRVDNRTARDFNNALDGLLSNVSSASKMVVLSLYSAVSGRIALRYFTEMKTSKYIENFRRWQESCCWRHHYIDSKKNIIVNYEGVPSFSFIARCIYGTEQYGKEKKRKEIILWDDDRRKKCPELDSVFEQLRPCVVDGKRIPIGIVYQAVRKATNRMGYDEEGNYLNVLHTACSLVKKYYSDKGVQYSMSLDVNCRNRSYLFGRLLAVAEQIERKTYKRDETRPTNAERYMRQFYQTPAKTWGIIRTNTQVYLNQLKPQDREFFKNLYCQISSLFEANDFTKSDGLEVAMILGYDCQRERLKSWGHESNTNCDEESEQQEQE